MLKQPRWTACLAVLLIFSLSACQTLYYAAWEKVGREKRHLLRDNVKKAGREQQQASEQFQDVLIRIKQLYGFDGGDLEKAYKRLKTDYELSEKRAAAVRERITEVETIAADLFAEWQGEIEQIQRTDLKAQSRRSLYETQRRYADMHQLMARAEQRMAPLQQQLKDYVLYLKHNLNAQAVGALRQEVGRIEIEVGNLVKELNYSVRAAENFLKTFQ